MAYTKPISTIIKTALVAIAFTTLYLILPTKTSTLDAYGYASYIVDGKNLFLSHHLLYNALGYIWLKTPVLLGYTDILAWLKYMNALFAGLAIYTLGLIFKELSFSWKKSLVWMIFAGSSWALMRFATENETYIIPVSFSILGSLFYLLHKTRKSNYTLILAGLFAATACLFHQIHFFWWLATLFTLLYDKSIRKTAFYLAPAAIVPIIYILIHTVYYHSELSINSIYLFVFRDFHSGAASVSIGAKSLMFAAANFVRSFIQVHGYFINLLKLSPWTFLGSALSAVCVVLAIPKLKVISLWKDNAFAKYRMLHIIAFALHLAFAITSHGNSEFMVMLPFLLAITLPLTLNNETAFIGFTASAMLIWNISMGLLPLHYFELNGNRMVANNILENGKSGSSLYIVFNKPYVDNQVKYMLSELPNTLSATQNASKQSVSNTIYEALLCGKKVYTDCIDRPKTLSRESLTMRINDDLFTGFSYVKVDSAKTLTGTYYLWSLKLEE